MRTLSNVCDDPLDGGLLWIVGGGVALSEAEAVQISSQVLTNVAQFYRSASSGYHANYAVQLEGVICWVDPSAKAFILEDDSGAVPVRADFRGATIRLGERVRLEGECSAERSGLGFVMTQALVVDNDGLHPPA